MRARLLPIMTSAYFGLCSGQSMAETAVADGYEISASRIADQLLVEWRVQGDTPAGVSAVKARAGKDELPIVKGGPYPAPGDRTGIVFLMDNAPPADESSLARMMAAATFMHTLLRNHHDVAFVVTSPTPRLLGELAAPSASQAEAILQIVPAESAASLDLALEFAAEVLADKPFARRAIVALADPRRIEEVRDGKDQHEGRGTQRYFLEFAGAGSSATATYAPPKEWASVLLRIDSGGKVFFALDRAAARRDVTVELSYGENSTLLTSRPQSSRRSGRPRSGRRR